jgi:hypothetical protein
LTRTPSVAQCGRSLLTLLVLHVGHDRDRALGREPFHRRTADPARRTRDQRDPLLQPLHLVSSIDGRVGFGPSRSAE